MKVARVFEHKGNNSSENYEKYNRSTLGVARYLRSYWGRPADAGRCVLLRAPAQKQKRKRKGEKYHVVKMWGMFNKLSSLVCNFIVNQAFFYVGSST
jgi:hypothetical protein